MPSLASHSRLLVLSLAAATGVLLVAQSASSQDGRLPPGSFEPDTTLRVRVGWPILDEQMRTWTDRNGKKVVALLGGRTPESLVFYREDGQRIEVHPDTFDAADRAYALQKTEKRVNPTSIVLLGTIARAGNGDLFQLKTIAGETVVVRMGGIDAPELNEPGGAAAKEWLSRFVGQKVRIEYFETTDRGHLISDVFLGDRWLNYEMVLAGWSRHDHRINVDRRLSGASRFAMKNERGVWQLANDISQIASGQKKTGSKEYRVAKPVIE